MRAKESEDNLRKKHYLPFQNMTSEAWINLLLATTISMYFIMTAFSFINGIICENFAFDYCGFWSAGKVINEHSFADVYNSNLLLEYQQKIFSFEPGLNTVFTGIPVAYLPIFLIPFKFLASIDLPISFFIWTVMNLAAFVFYLRFFSKSIVGIPLPNKLLICFLISFQIFMNFQEGQVNIWLMICAGEFLRAMLSGNEIKAGLWLGGWLLKPQLLIVILPFLLISRSYKIIKGFILSSLLIVVISLWMIDLDGLLMLKNILLDFSGGDVQSNNIAAMINWRMLGWHLTPLIGSDISWGLVILGALLTITLTLFKLRKKHVQEPTNYGIALVGIFAATCISTWHAHLHMSIVLIPPMLYLIINNKFDKRIFNIWVFLPTIFYLTGYVISTTAVIAELPLNIREVMRFSTGFPGFLVNLLVLVWAIKQYGQISKDAANDSTSLDI